MAVLHERQAVAAMLPVLWMRWANLQSKCNSNEKDAHKRYCEKLKNLAGDHK